jgi:hypothetical protein
MMGQYAFGISTLSNRLGNHQINKMQIIFLKVITTRTLLKMFHGADLTKMYLLPLEMIKASSYGILGTSETLLTSSMKLIHLKSCA